VVNKFKGYDHTVNGDRLLTSFPHNGDSDGLRNLRYLILLNAASYTGIFYRFGEPRQNNSFVVTEKRL